VVSIFPYHARSPGSNPGRSNTTQVEKSTSLQTHVYLRPTVKQFTAYKVFFLRSIRVSKNAEFYADSKSENEISKKCPIKKIFKKT